jgi:hypothetical protein
MADAETATAPSPATRTCGTTRHSRQRRATRLRIRVAAVFPSIDCTAECSRSRGIAEDAGASGLRPLVGLAHGIQMDRAPVVNGLTLPWSTGPVEGTVTKGEAAKEARLRPRLYAAPEAADYQRGLTHGWAALVDCHPETIHRICGRVTFFARDQRATLRSRPPQYVRGCLLPPLRTQRWSKSNDGQILNVRFAMPLRLHVQFVGLTIDVVDSDRANFRP